MNQTFFIPTDAELWDNCFRQEITLNPGRKFEELAELASKRYEYLFLENLTPGEPFQYVQPCEALSFYSKYRLMCVTHEEGK